MIVFIPRSAPECKPGDCDGEWLPRDCPGCGRTAIIGHGRRFRQAHDPSHDWIRVRRGICKECHRTLTALPFWCLPGSAYTAPARQEAIGALAKGLPVEQAACDCRDPDRTADPSTIRRWACRRIESLWVCAAARWTALLCAPTLFAWDFRAAARILTVESVPP
jgi:hypothetical protein